MMFGFDCARAALGANDSRISAEKRNYRIMCLWVELLNLSCARMKPALTARAVIRIGRHHLRAHELTPRGQLSAQFSSQLRTLARQIAPFAEVAF